MGCTAARYEHRDVLGVVFKDGRLVDRLEGLTRQQSSNTARAHRSLTGNIPLTKTFKLLQWSQSRQSAGQRVRARTRAIRLARPPAPRMSSCSQRRLSACSVAYDYDLAVYLLLCMHVGWWCMCGSVSSRDSEARHPVRGGSSSSSSQRCTDGALARCSCSHIRGIV